MSMTRETRMEMLAFTVLFWLVLAFVVIGPPYLVVRWLLRRDKRKRTSQGRVVLACPRCSSAEIVRKAADGISPFRGYICSGCQLHLRPSGTNLFYLSVLILSIGVLALFTMPLWLDDPGFEGRKFSVKVPLVCAVVAGYSGFQLFRPTPVRSYEASARRTSVQDEVARRSAEE